MQALVGKTVIITGSGGAIAGAVIEAFAGAGANLVLAEAHDSDRIRARAEAAKGIAVTCDLTTVAGAAEMVRRALERFGRIDGLIHTVGGFAMGKIHEVDEALYDRMFDLNVRTLFYAVRAVLPSLLARGDGFIAGFSSEPGKSGAAPNAALYGAAKSAVATFLRSLDGELAGTTIRVAIAFPMGAVDTPQNRRDMPSFDPAKFIDPHQIADTLVFAATRGERGRMVEFPIYPAR